MLASRSRKAGRPADARQRVDQGAAMQAEGPAHRGLAGAAIEGGHDRGQLLGSDCGGAAASATAPPCGRQPSLDPLLDQRPYELRQSPEDVEQELTLWGGGVDLLGQGAEGDARVLEAGHRGEEMRQGAPEAVELPDDQAVAGTQEGQRRGEAGTIIAAAAGVILEQVPCIDAGGEQSVALQIQHLPVAVGRDAHVADQHVRKTSAAAYPYTAPFRQGLS